MNLSKLETQTDKEIDYWINELKRYDWDKITMKPSETQWSMGQVAIHLWMSSKGFFFKNAERCLSQEKTQTGKSKNFTGHLVFTLKMFPPVKVKMPESVSVEPIVPESKEKLISKLEEIKGLAHQYIARIPQSDPRLKTRHPFLGWLNTAEWVQLCNIHFTHHTRQKKRIEKHFGWN
jgi:hypothetical protein